MFVEVLIKFVFFGFVCVDGLLFILFTFKVVGVGFFDICFVLFCCELRVGNFEGIRFWVDCCWDDLFFLLRYKIFFVILVNLLFFLDVLILFSYIVYSELIVFLIGK